jgi:hypothetical protein
MPILKAGTANTIAVERAVEMAALKASGRPKRDDLSP